MIVTLDVLERVFCQPMIGMNERQVLTIRRRFLEMSNEFSWTMSIYKILEKMSRFGRGGVTV